MNLCMLDVPVAISGSHFVGEDGWVRRFTLLYLLDVQMVDGFHDSPVALTGTNDAFLES